MQRLLAQFLLPPLIVIGGYLLGRWAGRPVAGITVGAIAAIALAAAFATYAVRRLRLVSVVSRRGRAGVLQDDPPDEIRDEIDREAYDSWRLAADSVEALANDRVQIAQQSMLIDRMQDGLMRVAADGVITFANVPAGSMFGGQNPTGRSFIRVTRDHELNQMLERCFASGSDHIGTLEIPGDQRLISAYISLLPTEEPEALVVFRDVTEVHRLQTLRRDFVANVSHELRTPLSTIKILTETLIELHGTDPEIAEYLTRLDGEVDAMSALVRDLLDLARLENQSGGLALREVDACQLVRDVRDRALSLASKHGVTVHVEAPRERTLLIGDDRRLHQALLNLVRNAIDHTLPGGSVTISAVSLPGLIALSVRDTGDGIAPDDLPRVWERFIKTDRARTGGGTGLGLAIVKHIAQALGGSVSAESVLGSGSTFEIRLPVDAAVLTDAATATATATT